MPNHLKISSPWTQLAYFMLLLGGAVIFTNLVIGGILVARIGVNNVHSGIDFSDPSLSGLFKLLQAISSITIFLLPAVIYSRLSFQGNPFSFLGFRKAEKSSFYLLGIALLLLSFPLEGWLGQINHNIPLPAWMLQLEKDADKQITAFLRADSPFDVVINVVVIALLPAICEEACFRGALQRILIQVFKSPAAGIVLTAIFFSAFHMQFLGFLPRMFLGILLGYLYWYSGSLWASVGAHFFTNGIQVVAVSFYPKLVEENPAVPVYAALISMVIVVGLLSVIRRQSTTTYARVYGPATDGYDEFPS